MGAKLKSFDLAMRTVSTLCKSNSEAQALGAAADVDGSGFIEKDEFTRIVGELLHGDEFIAGQLYKLACDYGREMGTSGRRGSRIMTNCKSSTAVRLSVDDFLDCLSVVHLEVQQEVVDQIVDATRARTESSLHTPDVSHELSSF